MKNFKEILNEINELRTVYKNKKCNINPKDGSLEFEDGTVLKQHQIDGKFLRGLAKIYPEIYKK